MDGAKGTPGPEQRKQNAWWDHLDRVIIAAAFSRENLQGAMNWTTGFPPEPGVVELNNLRFGFGDFGFGDAPKMSLLHAPVPAPPSVLCRFISNASKEQIRSQRYDMLRPLLPYGQPTIWAAYWRPDLASVGNSELIWLVETNLEDLYVYLSDQIALNTGASTAPSAEAIGAIARNIETLRLECGWSIAELAQKTGIDAKLIRRHRKGAKPTPRIRGEYADAFTEKLGRKITPLDLEK